jgi:hypothetical protein
MSLSGEQFLDDLVVTLIENFGTLTWFRTDDYDCPEDGPVTATIVDDDGNPARHHSGPHEPGHRRDPQRATRPG